MLYDYKENTKWNHMYSTIYQIHMIQMMANKCSLCIYIFIFNKTMFYKLQLNKTTKLHCFDLFNISTTHSYLTSFAVHQIASTCDMPSTSQIFD